MPTWKTYIIESKNKYSDYIRFSLDGSVRYKDSSKNYIDCREYSPFTEWEKDDRVDIDNDKTCESHSSKTFSFYDNVIYKLSSSSSASLTRVQSDYSDLQTNYSNLQRETEQEINRYSNLANNAREKYNDLVGEWNELKDKYNGMIDKYNDLARNSVKREGFERLEAEYRRNIADYNRLVGEHNGLQERNRELSQRFNRLNEDIEELREKHEETRTRHEEETRRLNQDILRISRSEERVRQEAVGLREQLTDTRQQLIATRNERDNLLIRANERNTEIQNLTNQMADLRIESNNRNNQLQNVQRELVRTQTERDERITATDLQELLLGIENRDREIASLREQLGQSQESGLTERIRNKTRRLESFVHRLGIEWEQIQLLRDICNELVRSHRDGDINGIRENQNIIDTIKQNFLQARVRLDDVQEICEKCEEIAQLNLQLGQQFEARQQQAVPLRRF